ncbi:hypothetical protein BU26DRAFT_228049 [Trematosphaeria pertusa]|uniref:F-box domain-containing protein n=1 Tax=Trematosphaeria pertusa TaxID=390896 RepID=A0A6A6IT50_9PLEO|nr:uncharacterized protein BU26DRAFT_228049 [Trematosphaeria pertusa]KAF2253674.1 hypothetical protein BU26DRAFT_228049 [Trematosphaeria pertusa]
MPAIAPPAPSGMLVVLAPELLELILSYLEPQHLTSFGQTCARARDFIRPNNQILWKASFLQVWDHPKHVWSLLTPSARAVNRDRESSWDWYREVYRRCKAFNVLCRCNSGVRPANVEDIVPPLLDVLDTASYSDIAEDGSRASLNLEFLHRLLQRCPEFDRVVHDYHKDIESISLPLELLTDSDRPITRSMLARRVTVPEWASRFHTFYGITQREEDSVRSKAAARALVYDWSVTAPNADFGPLVKDGSGTVHWQTVEAIGSLMHRIFATTLKAYRLSVSGFQVNVPFLLPPSPVAEDWAGITGTWMGTYAFLDYRALVHYNFSHNFEYPMDLGEYEEACGDLMRLKLKLGDSEELQQDRRLQTDLPYCKDLPKLFFTGSSGGRQIGRPSIRVRGFACLTPGGRQVRWRFIIRYAGSDQWQLEGVQPGGIRSGGIYGLWSHVDHDDHGAMGPFFYAPSELCDPSD